MKRPCNDDITPVFDWLYIGGTGNIRKTIPLVDIWYDFRWDRTLPKNLVVPQGITMHHVPFDDGNLIVAEKVWIQCFDEILLYKEQGKRVLVSCYEGVSRSAVLCLWLACHELRDYEMAMNHVKSFRNIYPHKEFRPFLKRLKEMYLSIEK
ncbi:protein tyrosine phosphatase [Bacillus paranthracis]|uniref:protein tyrosine phosphatase n=1 Tax=Bacillus paranthracis TaxID=2026186 RepID=UPI002FDBE0E2